MALLAQYRAMRFGLRLDSLDEMMLTILLNGALIGLLKDYEDETPHICVDRSNHCSAADRAP